MSTILLGLALLGVFNTDEARRVELPNLDATLFVPAGYTAPPSGVVDVVLHLHGASSVVEPAMTSSGWKAVLIVFNRKGLSSAYSQPFSDEGLFPKLLDAARDALKTIGVATDPKLGRVDVSSFSAGFGGVRALLKVPAHFARIDGLIMADSIYCGYTGDASKHEVDPALMDGFRRFATEAAAGRKRLLVSHSAQVPPGYASTTETADYLIHSQNGTSTAETRDWGQGWSQTRTFAKGRFLVLGFSGTEAADHIVHLRRIDTLWKRFLALGE
jgi:hypothetical protein